MALAALEAGAAQRHPLVEGHAVADLRGLADHHAGAVVDEELAADLAPPGGSRPRSPRGSGRRSRAAAAAPRPRSSAWATRWASSACTPAQLLRISKVETPCAAGSRSRAAATSARTSETTRFQRLMVRRRVGTCSARPSRRRSSPPSCRPSPAAPRPRSAALMLAPAEIPASTPSSLRRPAAPSPARPRRRPRRSRRSPSGRAPRARSRRRSPGSCAGRERRRRGPARLAGSTATTSASGARSFSIRPTPVIVPPVPTPATKAPISPSVSRQISSAVVRRWTSGLAGLENCCGMKALRCSRISSASVDRLVHPAQRGRLAHLGAVGAQQLRPLAAHPLRQGQDQLVAARGADHRQGDPGVAAGRLDDHRAPGLDQPLLLGGVDHRHPDPVLDRAAGVEVLELGADLARRAPRPSRSSSTIGVSPTTAEASAPIRIRELQSLAPCRPAVRRSSEREPGPAAASSRMSPRDSDQ